ncbi:VWA domain-containing protein [Streptomyces phaeochromogenes]|uniref:VWA domain-containing protein n=1 Tax=Streptomyces phaeochromogenes TaxID=1923 RepID=A0ABZ1HQC8_STRPH|nr:VWA domain-containing protein [Streptomyces phaeochromogenes]WSD20450.1 VWA domain-containing protein [Streptomyces phaeochromogenes]
MTATAVPLFDRAEFAGRLGAELRRAGVAVTPERTVRFLQTLVLLPPVDRTALYWAARLAFVTDREQIEPFERVFDAVFAGGPRSMAVRRAGAGSEPAPETAPGRPPPLSGLGPDPTRAPLPGGAFGEATDRDRPQPPDKDRRTEELPTAGSTAEVLSHKDFAALDPAELAELNRLLALLTLKAPLRRGRRQETDRRGRRIDLRRTLRTGQRTGGEAVLLARTRHRLRRRRLVLLCDISRSMEPYTRAYLRLFPRAAAGAAAEAFVFATRLTRLTPVLRHTGPSGVDAALRRAGAAASDWSGGTRIGHALAEFNNRFGRRGMARGAVVVIFSDGWEGEDPAAVACEMARLSRLTHRIIWVNPRKAAPSYTPRTAGMTAALPYCDAFISGHSLAALMEVVEAIAGNEKALGV